MDLIDKELEKVIKIKLGKFNNEEITAEDVQKLVEININNKDFSGREKDIRLQELKRFPKLRSIELSNFIIDDDIIELLNSFNEMGSLQLSSCSISSGILLNNPALKRLELDYCSVNDYSCISGTESLLIVGDRNIRLARISGKENIKNLTIQKSIVRDFSSITECTGLESLTLEEVSGDNNSVLEYIKNRNVKVEVKDEYKPMR